MSGKTIKDLPIYADEKQQSALATTTMWINIEQPSRSPLETTISTIRQSTCDFMHQFKAQKEKTIELVDKTKSNANSQLEYIRSETNLVPKFVFISLSGLSGLLIGFRKSTFRKLLYTSVLTVGSASLCYPKEAKVYYDQAYGLGRKTACDIYRQYIWPDEKTKSLKSKVAKPANDAPNVASSAKDKIIQLNAHEIENTKSAIVMKGDKGQANDDDKDMYTNRTK